MENSRGQNTDKEKNQGSGKDLQKGRLSSGNTVGGKQNLARGMKNTSGGTTDVGRNLQGGGGGRKSSGISTKRSVTGSDFDGQVSLE